MIWTDRESARDPLTRRRMGLRGAVLSVLALLSVIAASLALYFTNRHYAGDHSASIANCATADCVYVSVQIEQVETSDRRLNLSITDVSVSGAYAEENGHFRTDLQVTTGALNNEVFTLKKGEDFTDAIQQHIELAGVVTDYPFDRYRSSLWFHITDPAGATVPTVVMVSSTDPFFTVTSSPPADIGDSGVQVDVAAHRNPATIVFVMCIMALVIGLAIAAVTTAYNVLRWHRGLVLAASSMMAGLLFSMIPLRNGLPGGPPIGSVVDYGAFFIAEIVIGVSLIATVLIGYRQEMTNEYDEALRADASRSAPDP